MKIIKRLFLLGLLILCGALLSLYFSNKIVENHAKDKLFSNTESISYNKVGLLLGTGKYLRNGRINLFYTNRIKATIELFKAGKISYVIISGDNSRKDYDEPTDMMNDLIVGGIPKEKIYLDYAGFRTLDSVVRCKEIFGQEKITIISQKFHNERAIYIAYNKDIKAIGYNAKAVPEAFGRKTLRREYFARVKLMLDLIIGKDPKFLGDKITIE